MNQSDHRMIWLFESLIRNDVCLIQSQISDRGKKSLSLKKKRTHLLFRQENVLLLSHNWVSCFPEHFSQVLLCSCVASSSTTSLVTSYFLWLLWLRIKGSWMKKRPKSRLFGDISSSSLSSCFINTAKTWVTSSRNWHGNSVFLQRPQEETRHKNLNEEKKKPLTLSQRQVQERRQVSKNARNTHFHRKKTHGTFSRFASFNLWVNQDETICQSFTVLKLGC